MLKTIARNKFIRDLTIVTCSILITILIAIFFSNRILEDNSIKSKSQFPIDNSIVTIYFTDDIISRIIINDENKTLQMNDKIYIFFKKEADISTIAINKEGYLHSISVGDKIPKEEISKILNTNY